MKKILIAVVAALCLVLFGGTFISLYRQYPSATKAERNVDLNERLADVTGAYTLRIKGDDNTLEIATSGYTLLGSERVDSIVIEGEGVNETTIRATGEGAGRIQANGNGTLVIRNATIVDETPHKGTYYWDYLLWGGKVVFENCAFKQSIVLKTSSASFKNCTFHSPWTKYYSVWISHGATRFEGCTFTGTRGLKIHEYEGEDITTVELDGCTFDRLSEKPGLAIGTFIADPAQTTVSVKNSRFLNCHAWDTVGSLEGVDGFYEADMPTTDFVFIDENNTVEYNG